MKKLVVAEATAVALSAGLANAADLVVRPMYHPVVNTYAPMGRAPLGVAGARWGNLCWVDVDSGHYAGYWAPCVRR
jgi:hypothetical protein